MTPKNCIGVLLAKKLVTLFFCKKVNFLLRPCTLFVLQMPQNPTATNIYSYYKIQGVLALCKFFLFHFISAIFFDYFCPTNFLMQNLASVQSY